MNNNPRGNSEDPTNICTVRRMADIGRNRTNPPLMTHGEDKQDGANDP